MKIKRKLSFIFLIIILFVTTFSFVSAEDTNLTDIVDASEEISIEDDVIVEQMEQLGVSEDSEVIGVNYTPASSSEIQSYIDSASEGDTIVFDGYYLINSTINVNKRLNFVGVNDATIDGNRSVRLFSVSSSGVTFKNISFINGYSTSSIGSAVSFSGSGSNSVVNCNFTNNNGGSVVYFNNIGTVANCNFVSNSPSSRYGEVYFKNNGTVANCNFNGINKGSAVYFNKGGKSTVTYCNFTNYSTYGEYGGAVYFTGDGTVTYCNFVNNSASRGGGAVYFDGGIGTVTYCNFTDNKATRNYGYGGAVYFSSTGNVINCNFVNNSASADGGAVYFWKGNVTNCNFTDNSASSHDGGAVYFSSTGNVINCNFVNNSASGSGGAVYGRGNVINCNFVNNSASGSGGAVDGRGNVINCNFANNKATGDYSYGGAVYFSSNGEVTNCNFVNNSASDGGAVYFSSTSNVTNCNFVNNSASGSGGAIRIYSGSVENCNFVNNSASSSGGAVYFYSTGNVTYCNFVNNSASGSGGAVYFYRTGNVTYCNFTGNSASSIFIKSTPYDILNCIFDVPPSYRYHYTTTLKISSESRFLVANLSNICGPAAGKTVTFYINGNVINQTTDSRGLIRIELSDGEIFSVAASFAGDDINDPISENTTVIPISLSVNDLDIFMGDVGYLIVNVSDIHGLPDEVVSFIIDGNEYNITTDSNGLATLKVTDYLSAAGNYTVKIIFTKGNYVDSINSSVVIKKYDSSLNVNNLDIFIDEDGYLVADLSDSRGKLFNKTVTFNLANNNYKAITDLDGQAKIKITDYLTEYGSYDVGVSFAGDEFNNPISTTANIVLNRYESILDVNDSSYIRGEENYFVVALSDIRGSLSNKNVTLMINNKKYLVITDSNGIAKINIADIISSYGYYNVGVNFDGDNFNKPVSNNVNVSIVNYKGILTVNQVGKYYGDTNLTFNLVNSKTNLPISNTAIYVTFSNGVSDTLFTDSEGNANYQLLTALFAPGDYVVNASVSIPYVDINSVVKDFVVSEFIGEIEISQAEDCRVLNIRLSNPETGDVFKDFTVTLAFTPNDSVVVNVKTDENGIVNYTMGSFNEGIYSVTASVNGQYMHFTPKTLENFVINNKINSIVEFIPKNGLKFDYLSSGTIALYLNGCTVDLANISVVDHPEAIIGIDENEFIIVSNLTAGSYTLQVISTPNEGYNSVTKTTGITVNKINSYLSLTPVSFDYGKSGSIDFDVNGATVELENIHVLNHPEAVISLNNNKITVSNLSAGTYTLDVTSTPDDNHIAVSENTTITVNKVDSSISLTPISFDYGQTGTGNFNVVGGSVLRSNIQVLNHPEAGINIYNNVISVSDLNAGRYTLQVTSTPDDNHKSVTKTTEIIVNKVDSTLTFTKAISFDYGGSDSTSVDFYGCTIQSNNIKVLNHPEAIITFTGKVISVSGLDAGVYSLSVTSSPDDNHNAVTRTISVTVNKIDSNVRFTRELSFNYGGSDSTVIVLDGCTVDLADICVVGHDEAIITFNNNEITVSGLDAGKYTLSVVSTPDTNYNSVTKTTKITVNRIDSSISFNSDELIFNQGSSASVGLTVGGCTIDAEGISVDNHPEAVINLNNNIITVSNLTYGSYTLTVVSNPDKNHNAVSRILPITVNKMLSNVTFGGDIVFDYGDTGSTWIKVTGGGVSPSDISIVGHSEADITMTSNNIIFVSNLNVGVYTLKVISTPDENHRSVEATVPVIVNKANSSVEFNDISFDYGDSGSTDIKVTGGKLLLSDISVIGQSDAKITYNGKSITVSDLDAGSYTLQVTTTPDSNHNAVNATVNVYVNKIDSVLVLSDDVVFDYGDSGYTVITAGGDDVSLSGISVVGEADAKISLNNYKITVSNLDAGRYTLRVTTSPDKNHNPITRNVNIVVNKIDSVIGLTNAVIFDYGGFGSTNVNVIGGDVKSSGISVDGQDNAQISLNGREISVSNLNAGTYILRVTTSPDKNHNPVTGTTSVIVNKVDSDFTFNNNVSFNYGGTGFVGVNVHGCSIVKSGISVDNHNEAIIDIKDNVISVSNLAVGNYILRAVSTPDGNHKAVTKTVGIAVGKSDSSIGFTNEISFDYGSVGTTTLILDGCTVKESDCYVVGHSEAVVKISDMNVISVSNLTVGKYTLRLSSIPDDNHVSVNATININVNKIDSKVSFSKSVVSFKYSKSGSVVMTLEGCSVKLADVSVVGHKEAKFTLKDNTIGVSNLAVGTYTLKVTTTPDAVHNSIDRTIKISVTKNTAKITVKKQTFAYKKAGKWAITLKDSSGKAISKVKVTLKVYTGKKAKPYTSTVTNSKGVAYFNQIKALSLGNHKVILSFSHAGYTCKSVSSSIKVIKQTPLKFKVTPKTTRKGFSITITVKDKTGKRYVNGVKVKLSIGSGKNMKSFVLVSGNYGKGKGVCAYSTNMMPAGTHKVTVTSAVVNYAGSAASKVTLKAGTKKWGNWWEKISNGKATSSGLK